MRNDSTQYNCGHFVTRIPLRLALPLVGNKIDCDHREQGPKAADAPRSGLRPRRAYFGSFSFRWLSKKDLVTAIEIIFGRR